MFILKNCLIILLNSNVQRWQLKKKSLKSRFRYVHILLQIYKCKVLPSIGYVRVSKMDGEQKSVEPNPEYGKIDAIIGSYSGEKSALIAILQEIENIYGYLPAWALRYVSEKLGTPMIQVYGVASFYDSFHLKPRGKHLIRVCLGTACYLRGSGRVLEAIEKELGIKDGGTTDDLEFTIQSVRCLGACALAPVMVVGERYFDKMTPTKVGRVLKQIQGKKDDD